MLWRLPIALMERKTCGTMRHTCANVSRFRRAACRVVPRRRVLSHVRARSAVIGLSRHKGAQAAQIEVVDGAAELRLFRYVIALNELLGLTTVVVIDIV